jgi:carboxyl-terminal processing protease
VQTIIPLEHDNGAMRLTTAEYFTPSGRSIQAMGITPDILVPQAKLEYKKTAEMLQESDLRNAFKNPGHVNKADAAKIAKDVADEKALSKKDYQLSRALDLLRGIALYRNDSHQQVTKR